MISHPTVESIADHTQAVQRGAVECRLQRCPKCDQGSFGFKYHGWRQRWFYVIVGRVVKRVLSTISRWKCGVCNKTFTLYPDFGLPYKRYVRQDLCRLSERYVSDDGLSYRKAVEVNRMSVFYNVPEGGRDATDERSLSHTTVHRWISFLGALKQTLSQAWQLIRAESPSCALFRSSAAVPAHKYRSEPRKQLLHTCGRVLQADQAYRNLFEVSIFPHLGTGCHWC